MRVCPKCKFVDPPEWRHSKFSYWIDFTEWENFQQLHPKLAMQLEKNPELAEDEDYIYRLTKTKQKVHRKAKVDYGYQWNIPMEKRTLKDAKDFRKHWQLTHPSQTKLLEAKP